MDTYVYLMKTVPEKNWICLEDIVTQYEVLEHGIFRDLNITISKNDWESIVSSPSRNKTRIYKFPHYSDWNQEQKSIYREVLGNVSQEPDYDVDW